MGHALGVAQAHHPGGVVRHALDGVAPLLQYAEALVHIGEELQAVRGEPDLLLLLLEELDAQLLLQLVDGVAQAGLGDMELLRRMGVVQRAG